MIMAAFGGVFGNLPGLEAVLDAIDCEGIHTVVNTGDSVGLAPWPDAVLGHLQVRSAPSVQGTWDRAVARFARTECRLKQRLSPVDYENVRWAFENIAGARLEFLASLRKTLRLTVEGVSVVICHGTPASQSDVLHVDSDAVRFERVREQANADVIVCGQSRTPFVREVGGTLFVNPGYAGLPVEGEARATYVLITAEEPPWRAEIRSATYDAARIHDGFQKAGLALPEPFAELR